MAQELGCLIHWVALYHQVGRLADPGLCPLARRGDRRPYTTANSSDRWGGSNGQCRVLVYRCHPYKWGRGPCCWSVPLLVLPLPMLLLLTHQKSRTKTNRTDSCFKVTHCCCTLSQYPPWRFYHGSPRHSVRPASCKLFVAVVSKKQLLLAPLQAR